MARRAVLVVERLLGWWEELEVEVRLVGGQRRCRVADRVVLHRCFDGWLVLVRERQELLLLDLQIHVFVLDRTNRGRRGARVLRPGKLMVIEMTWTCHRIELLLLAHNRHECHFSLSGSLQ